MHYFDYAASTPLHPEASHVFVKLSEQCYGNTSSLHDVGGVAQNMLALCRQEFADLLGIQTAGVYFTSGGTESNLLSIISLAKANRHRGKHIITTAGEHPSIDSALDYLQQEGFTVTVVPFDQSGHVDLQIFQKALREDTILASVQHINPEIGVIQPMEKIAELLKDRQILLHSDCVQSFGKMNLKPIAKIVDSLTVSSHKVYGPKGVGAAYIHPRHRIIPVFPGFVHEAGFRGGTVNVPGIASFITAAILCAKNSYDTKKYKALRSIFMDELNKHSELFTIYEASTAEAQLPQIIGLGVNNVEGQLIMLELNRYGFAISTGSACQVGQQHSSKAMLALQVDPQRAKEFIRISFGHSTTIVCVQQLVGQLIQIAKQVRSVMMVE